MRWLTRSKLTPTRPTTPEYSYKFSGWSPSVSTVSGAQTYTAQYDATQRIYTLTINYYEMNAINSTDISIVAEGGVITGSSQASTATLSLGESFSISGTYSFTNTTTITVSRANTNYRYYISRSLYA